jgi:hypothetical protein
VTSQLTWTLSEDGRWFCDQDDNYCIYPSDDPEDPDTWELLITDEGIMPIDGGVGTLDHCKERARAYFLALQN